MFQGKEETEKDERGMSRKRNDRKEKYREGEKFEEEKVKERQRS